MSLTFTVLDMSGRPVVKAHDFATAQRLAGWGRKQVLGRGDTCGTCAEGVRRMAENTDVHPKGAPPPGWGG